jgi:hypothetical protein
VNIEYSAWTLKDWIHNRELSPTFRTPDRARYIYCAQLQHRKPQPVRPAHEACLDAWGKLPSMLEALTYNLGTLHCINGVEVG